MPIGHSFHIPVMGTCFTVDSPLKVGRYGISSTISLVDDRLVEKIRRYYCHLYGEKYVPVGDSDFDARARRITAYLNLVDKLVKKQIRDVRTAPFDSGSEITRYFELLDDRSVLKQQYRRMLEAKGADEKNRLQSWLREQVVAGSIDVNIMTKLDRENYAGGEKLSREHSDAMAAVRGFAKSDASSSIILSAGVNLHLFRYMANFDDFYADAEGVIKKKITLKVSDFKSALTQGKIFAKKGLWISEYRVESGLNCGGHAFPTLGRLLGPVLEEFQQRRQELIDTLYDFYRRALSQLKKIPFPKPCDVRVTVQGGIGTSEEDKFLLRRFGVAGTGWGTPFLLVPEATSVDEETMEKLAKADERVLYLSDASPLGIPFHNLRNSASEEARRARIRSGKPGSPCHHGHVATNTEFSYRPLCVASRHYQAKKIDQLRQSGLSEEDFAREYNKVVEKSCICHDLGDGALSKYNIRDHHQPLAPAICPGPNLAYFSQTCSLKEMVDHIYGRLNLIAQGVERPHMFINELRLYIDFLKKQAKDSFEVASKRQMDYFVEFKKNLMDGIEYYKKLAYDLIEESEQRRDRFLRDLTLLKEELDNFALPFDAAVVTA